MHAPGVEVRPLRQMTGGASFNEVFFTDVRIPDSHRLGDVNGGWTVALTTLMNERAAIGGGGGGVGLPTTTRLIELTRAIGRSTDPLIRQQLAAVIINERVASYTNLRAMAKIAVGQLPGPEMSLAKLALTANMVRTCNLLSSALGPGPDRRHRGLGHLRAGRSSCWGYPACGSPAGPTRSCATSSANGSSDSPRIPRPTRSRDRCGRGSGYRAGAWRVARRRRSDGRVTRCNVPGVGAIVGAGPTSTPAGAVTAGRRLRIRLWGPHSSRPFSWVVGPPWL